MGRQVPTHKIDQVVRRPTPLSSRTPRAEMSRAGFFALVAGWSCAVAVILAVSAFARLVV
jgi:hypothetical protein